MNYDVILIRKGETKMESPSREDPQKIINQTIGNLDCVYDEKNLGTEEWAEIVWVGIDDSMDDKMKQLRAYVQKRIDKIIAWNSYFFQEKSIKALFKKMNLVKNDPNLSEFDRMIVEDLIDYIYTYSPLSNNELLEQEAIHELSSQPKVKTKAKNPNS